MPCAEQLAALYRRECVDEDHTSYSSPPTGVTSIARASSQKCLSRYQIGPLIRFSHLDTRDPSSVKWTGSMLLAVRRGYSHVSVTMQRFPKLPIDAAPDRALPERPIRLPGIRLVDSYDCHFWRFDINTRVEAEETVCTYTIVITRDGQRYEARDRFLLPAKQCYNWRIDSSLCQVQRHAPLVKMPQRHTSFHMVILPDWSPFFLENQIRAEKYIKTYSSTPYMCRHGDSSLRKPLKTSQRRQIFSDGTSSDLWQTIFSQHLHPYQARGQDGTQNAHVGISLQSLNLCAQFLRKSFWSAIQQGTFNGLLQDRYRGKCT